MKWKIKLISAFFHIGLNRITFLVMLSMSLYWNAKSQTVNDSVTAFVRTCTSDSNTITFDVIIKNESTVNNIALSSFAMGIDLNYSALLPGGETLNSIQLLAGTSQLNPVQSGFSNVTPNPYIGTNNPNLSTTSTPTKSIRIAPIATNKPYGTLILKGSEVRVGSFIVKASANWLPGTTPTWTFIIPNTGITGKQQSKIIEFYGPNNVSTTWAASTTPTSGKPFATIVQSPCNNFSLNLCPFTSVGSSSYSGCGTVNISGTVTNVFDSVRWTTSGTGSFGFPTSTGSNTYTPGIGETNATLTFRAYRTGCSNATTTASYTNTPLAGVKNIITSCASYTWPVNNQTYTFSGTYTHSTINASNCTTIDSLLLTINALPTVTISTNSPLCVGDTIKLISSGGSSYSWTGPNGFASTQQNPIITNVSAANAGTYFMTVANSNGCTALSSSTVIVTASTTYYADADGDGYGVTSNTQQLCTPSGIYTVTVGGDCNDNNVNINPGAIEICGNGIDDNCDGQIDEGCSVSLNLKLYIEGFYTGNGTMVPVIDQVNYPNLCDTITVELHEAIPQYGIVQSVTGTIDINGNGQFVFPGSIAGNNYYIVIRHRNSIETWSKDPIFFNLPVVSLDFTAQ